VAPLGSTQHRTYEMPRVPLHALIWSKDHGVYEQYTQGRLAQRVRPEDEATWLAWLREVSSFAFHGLSGSLNVYQERRPRGGSYWYAYHTSQDHTRKRYLGRTESVSLARLEETAQALTRGHVPIPAIPATGQELALLSTRLVPPRLPRVLVERARLLAALDGALSTPLTLLSAAAGWGKTTLLATWASQQTIQVAWLSLDERYSSQIEGIIRAAAAKRF
jgi:LuxR family transcriptional regulator, maltose regulon positive regulatory protein